MTTKRYSLANYKMTITLPDSIKTLFPNDIVIGGQGTTVASITVSRNQKLYSVNSYNTGGYVFDKNLDRSGTVSLNINFLDDNIIRFIRIVNAYYDGDYDGFTISVTDTDNKPIVKCIDCMPGSIPNLDLGNTSPNQSWSFDCGQILFETN